jgi:aryl-alcohol dehydrogenase-like predicted oxidoreductase
MALQKEHATPSAAAAGTLTLGGALTVNRLGFGAMRLTGKGIFGPPADRDECRSVLRRAVELGVTFIDTADSYGPAVSEDIIAEALHPYPDDLVIATKGGLERPGPDQWTPDGRPEHLRQACEDSLRRLRLERIDLYQLHRIDPAVPEADQFGVLEDLHREGKIRFVGLSEAGVAEIERARKTLPVVSVQNRFNVAERTWDPVVDYCQQHGLAFIPWFPLAAGALGTPRAVETVAKKHASTPMQIAIAWLLARSPIVLPIPGTSKVSHLEENVAAASIALSDEDLHELETVPTEWQPPA